MNEKNTNQILNGIEQGSVTTEDIEALNKALSVGNSSVSAYIETPTTRLLDTLSKVGSKSSAKMLKNQQGGPLHVESLEATLKSVVHDMQNIGLLADDDKS